MPRRRRCSKCGAEPQADPGLQGLCPRCLLILGLGADAKNRKRIGNYEILSELGRGGMGIVYKAYQVPLNRIVALKVLTDDVAQDKVFIRRFEREAKSAAQLNHPNVITIYDIGQEGDTHFIAMEYVKGKTIAELVGERGQLVVPYALKIVQQVLSGLGAAHALNIIHRDIKPQNILIDGADCVKVADFGLAKSVEDTMNLTQSGAPLGTPAYMSPEQCRGETIDERTDLYAVGVLLYQMLAGRVPFPGKNLAEVIQKTLNEPVPAIGQYNREVPEATWRIIERALAKRAADRYASTAEMNEDITAAMGSYEAQTAVGLHKGAVEPVGNRLASAIANRFGRLRLRHALYATAAIATLVSVGIGLGSVFSPLRRLEEPRVDVALERRDEHTVVIPSDGASDGARRVEDVTPDAGLATRPQERPGAQPVTRGARPSAPGMLRQVQVLRHGVEGVDYLQGASDVAVSPDGKHVYVTAVDSRSLTTLARDASSGQLTLVQTLQGMVGMDEPTGVVVAPNGNVVYVASSGGNESIAVLERNPSTGELTLAQSIRNGENGVIGLDGVGAFVLSNDGRHLYHVSSNESPESALTVFACDEATGRLSFVQAIHGGEDGPSDFIGHGHIAISPGGRHVYVIAENERSIAAYRRDWDTGTLEFVQILRNGEEGISGLDALRAVVCSRDGRNVYTLDAGSVGTFSRDYDTGELSPVQSLSDGMGSIANLGGAFSLAETVTGKHLYVVSVTGHSLNVFARDDAMGTLRHIQHLQDDTDGVDGLGGPFSITLSPDGRHVYVATGCNNYGNDNALAVFARERGPLFPDPNLEAAVREALGKPEGVLTDEDLLGITRLDPQGISDLRGIELCSNLRWLSLSISGGESVKELELSPIASLTGLRVLEFWTDSELAESQMANLSGLGNVRHITVPTDDVGLRQLTGLRNLEHLDIHYSSITDSGIEWIVSQFPGLTGLNVAYCPNITDESMVSVSQLDHLGLLEIQGSPGIGIEGVSYLGKASSLSTLSLGGSRTITDAVIETVSQFPQLRNLIISDVAEGSPLVELSSAALEYLKRMQGLEGLTLPVDYCAKVSLDELEALRTALPACTLSIEAAQGFDFNLYVAVRQAPSA